MSSTITPPGAIDGAVDELEEFIFNAFTVEAISNEEYIHMYQLPYGNTDGNVTTLLTWHDHLCAGENATGDYPDEESFEHGQQRSAWEFNDACDAICILNEEDYNAAGDIILAHSNGQQCPLCYHEGEE